MSILDNNRRKHDDLRKMVDQACAGVMPHIERRIKDAARRAYFLGARDGMEMVREQNKEPQLFWIMGKEFDLSKGEHVTEICDIISDAQERQAPNDLSLIASTLLNAALEARSGSGKSLASRTGDKR